MDRYKSAKQREGRLTNNSVNKTLQRLAEILETAVEYEKINRNPAKGKKRRLKGETRARSHVEPEQLPSLLDGCSPSYRILVATLAGAGLRIAEAIALRWRHVNLAAGTIRVEDSKTAAGVRVVDMPDGLASEMRLHKARACKTGQSDPVFCKVDGGPQNVRNAEARLKPAIRKANRRLEKLGIEPVGLSVTPHSLRRTFISLLLATGADVPYVMEQAGHSDPKVTLGIYARAIRRRNRLTGAHLEEFDTALEWAQLGTNALPVPNETPANGLIEPVED